MEALQLKKRQKRPLRSNRKCRRTGPSRRHPLEEGRRRKGKAKLAGPGRKPEKQPGAPGHSRTQRLAVTGEEARRAERCAAVWSGARIEQALFVARRDLYGLDIEWGDAQALYRSGIRG